MLNIPLRIEQKIERIPECGCWIWTGAQFSNGYANMKVKNSRKNCLVHRVLYELVVGPIPSGLDIDHLCRVRCCVNPAHLEPVTRRENLRRAGIIDRLIAQGKSWFENPQCKSGHQMTKENTYIYPNGRHRACRICMRIYRSATIAKRKEA